MTLREPNWPLALHDGGVPDDTEAQVGGGLCSFTTDYWNNNPPINHGCCQQHTITGASLSLNTYPTVFYRDDGIWGGHVCEIRWAYNHEFGHTLGLGHTVDAGQTMHFNEVSVY